MASNLRVDSIVPATGAKVSIGTATGGVTIPGDLGIAGVLTYEDVTNVDSVGVITARSGIDAASNLLLKTGGTDRLKITSGGDIEVQGESSSSPYPVRKLKWSNDQSTTNGFYIAQHSDRIGRIWHEQGLELAFGTSNTERLRIGVSGQIGIGGANYGSSGQVLTSQGASAAVAWASLAVGKFASFAVVADANNTGNQNGGTFSNGAWRTRILDTEISDTDSIVSLSSNQFTLQAGNYFIVAWASALQVNGHQARLRDVTNSATRAHGSSEYTGNGDYVTTKSWIYTRVTPSSATAYELQHRCQTSASNVGFGNGSGDQWTQESNGDTYCMVIIFKEV